MRTLRYLALLSMATAAFAAEKPNDAPDTGFQLNMEWKAPVRGPDGTWQFRALPNSTRLRVGRILPQMVARDRGGNVCYSIRSYAVKRVDGTDETVPAGVTTCTPASRFQLREAAPRK